MSRIPQALSEGEEMLAFHLRAKGIHYEREVCLIPGRKWRYDFRVGNVVVEVHGAIWQQGKHARGDGLEWDYAKMNAAVAAGFLPLQYSTGQVLSGEAIQQIEQILSASRT